jgi:hypothetical protein
MQGVQPAKASPLVARCSGDFQPPLAYIHPAASRIRSKESSSQSKHFCLYWVLIEKPKKCAADVVDSRVEKQHSKKQERGTISFPDGLHSSTKR